MIYRNYHENLNFMKTKLIMKKNVLLFIIILVLTGCNEKENEERDFILAQIVVELSRGGVNSIQVSGGSGKYSATINDSEIAEVWINSENKLFIDTRDTKKSGEAVITVIDDNSGKSIDCILTVIENREQFKIIETQFAVDAGVKEAVEADLRENSFPIGSSFVFTLHGENTVVINNPDNNEILRGTYTTVYINNESTIQTVFPESYKLLPPYGQVVGALRYNIVFGEDNNLVYDMILSTKRIVSTYTSPPEQPNFFYEDLTDYYKTKYPDAGVKGVVRSHSCEYDLYRE